MSAFFICLYPAQASPSFPETLVDALVERAGELQLGREPEWQALLMIHRHFGERTLIDSPGFLLASVDNWTPQNELSATLRALVRSPEGFDKDKHPLCLFPARRDFLTKHLPALRSRLPEVTCPRMADFLRNSDYKGVSLVFSSYYTNNPASMFGHTFIRLHKADPGEKKSALLDDAINFAAYPDTSNPILYTLKGSLGGFPGRFGHLPYYLKVQEYNNSDRRDLWEYKLDYTPQEIRRIVLLLWEVGPHHVNYLYFDENCSSLLLMLLNAGRPAQVLPFYHPWIIPSDTIRALWDAGIVTSITYRPSSLTRFLGTYSSLGETERKAFHILIEDHRRVDLGRKPLLGQSDGSQARILDAILEFIEYEERLAGTRLANKFADLRSGAIRQRIKVKARPQRPFVTPTHTQPHLGHRTSRLEISPASIDNEATLQLGWRPALHDMLGEPRGYATGLQIGFFHPQIRVQEKAAWLQRFSLINIKSVDLSPPIVRGPAWTLDVETRQHGCTQFVSKCYEELLSGGVGRAWPVGLGHVTVMIGTEVGQTFQNSKRAYIGPWLRAALWYGFSGQRVEWHGEFLRHFVHKGEPENRLTQKLTWSKTLSMDREIRGSWLAMPRSHEAKNEIIVSFFQFF